jgi:hypothetical protein
VVPNFIFQGGEGDEMRLIRDDVEKRKRVGFES